MGGAGENNRGKIGTAVKEQQQNKIKLKRCLSSVSCNYHFLDGSASCCAFQCISSCYIFFFGFHGRKQKYFLDFIDVCENHGDSVNAVPQPAVGQPLTSVTWPHHRQWSWPVLQKAATWGHSVPVTIVYFLLHDRQFKGLSQTLFRAVLFGQRAHYLGLITD